MATGRHRRRRRGARPVPGRSAWCGKGAVHNSGDHRKAAALLAGMPGSRPGGTPEEISRGQGCARGRRPRKPCPVAPCPSGASKKMDRGDGWWRKYSVDRTPQKNFFDAPLGHGPFGGATGGRARGAGLPPANFLRSPSGTKNEAVATILWSSACDMGSSKILASRGFFHQADDRISPPPIRPFRFPCPKFPCQTRPCSRAVPANAVKQIACVPPRAHHELWAQVVGNFRRPRPPPHAATGDRSRSVD